MQYMTEHWIWVADLSYMNENPTRSCEKIILSSWSPLQSFISAIYRGVWTNRTGRIISFIFAPSHFGQPRGSLFCLCLCLCLSLLLSLSLSPPDASIMNLLIALRSWWPPRAEFWRSAGCANTFLYFYFCCSGEMLSLEDGTSSGGGQDTERAKREGPSEYENKTKQVCSIYLVCKGQGHLHLFQDKELLWTINWCGTFGNRNDSHWALFLSVLTWKGTPENLPPQRQEHERC